MVDLLSCPAPAAGAERVGPALQGALALTTITATGNHWVVTTHGAHCTVVVGDVVGNDRYDVQAVNDDCTVATSDAAAAASQIAQGMADGTMLH